MYYYLNSSLRLQQLKFMRSRFSSTPLASNYTRVCPNNFYMNSRGECKSSILCVMMFAMGNYRRELTSTAWDEFIYDDLDFYLFTDTITARSLTLKNWEVIGVNLTTNPSSKLPINRYMTKAIKFGPFSETIKKYMYVLSIDAKEKLHFGMHMMWPTGKSIIDYITRWSNVSLFYKTHPTRCCLSNEIEELIPKSEKQPTKSLQLWNSTLHELLSTSEVAQLPLIDTALFIRKTRDPELATRDRAVLNILIKYGLWRDQVVWGYVFRDWIRVLEAPGVNKNFASYSNKDKRIILGSGTISTVLTRTNEGKVVHKVVHPNDRARAFPCNKRLV